MGRFAKGALLLAGAMAWGGAPAGAQTAPAPGSAGREGSALVIRNDGNPTQKTFYIANGAFYPSNLWMGNRRVDSVDQNGYPTYTYEPAYGPGCETERNGPIEFGGVRCPLAGVTEIVVELGEGRLTLMASGAAPPVRVRGGMLDAMPVSGAAAQHALAPPALTTLRYETTGASGTASSMFGGGQLQRFEYAGGPGADEVLTTGADAVGVATGGGDDRVVVENAGGAAQVSAGAGDDNVHLAARPGATSSIDAGAGDDILRSDDRVATAIACGPGDDQLAATTADRAGAGCAPPIAALEPFSGFTTCVAAELRCDFALGRKAARGTLNAAGTAVTVRGVGRLPKPAVVWGRIATKHRLYGSGALAGDSGTRRPAGQLELKLRLAKGKSGRSLKRKGLRMLLGTRTRSGDVSTVVADLDGIAFRLR